MKHYKTLAVFTALMLSLGCASTNKTPSQATAQSAESRIEGNFPVGSPFSKIRLGMSQGQIHEILGQPTDTKSYQTGKAWIPFYFGSDVMRTDEFYQGVGTITYTGAGIGGTHWTVLRAIYNATANGFPGN